MSDPINIRALAPGTRITLADGAEAEIVSNPADGVWLFARYLSSPRDPALVGQEDMIFAAEIVEVRPAPSERGMLELRPNCEYCDTDLPPHATETRICSYECTFCADCIERDPFNASPTCVGSF